MLSCQETMLFGGSRTCPFAGSCAEYSGDVHTCTCACVWRSRSVGEQAGPGSRHSSSTQASHLTSLHTAGRTVTRWSLRLIPGPKSLPPHAREHACGQGASWPAGPSRDHTSYGPRCLPRRSHPGHHAVMGPRQLSPPCAPSVTGHLPVDKAPATPRSRLSRPAPAGP